MNNRIQTPDASSQPAATAGLRTGLQRAIERLGRWVVGVDAPLPANPDGTGAPAAPSREHRASGGSQWIFASSADARTAVGNSRLASLEFQAAAGSSSESEWHSMPGNILELGATGVVIRLRLDPRDYPYVVLDPEGRCLGASIHLTAMKMVGEQCARERSEFAPSAREGSQEALDRIFKFPRG